MLFFSLSLFLFKIFLLTFFFCILLLLLFSFLCFAIFPHVYFSFTLKPFSSVIFGFHCFILFFFFTGSGYLSLSHSFIYFFSHSLFRLFSFPIPLDTWSLSVFYVWSLCALSLSILTPVLSALSPPPCFYHWSPRYSSLSNYSCASLSYFIVIRVSLLVLSLKFLSLFLCVWIPLSLDIWSLCVSLKYVSVCVSSFLARRSRIISLLLLGTRRFGWRLQMYKRGSVWWKTRK